jgi:hypothetical protein
MIAGASRPQAVFQLPGEFPVRRFRLRFQANEPYTVRGYRGSAWRGIFGPGLKNLVCITREKDCSSCLVRKSCAYPYIFETPAERAAAKPASIAQAPHPYVLFPEPEWRRRVITGETLEVTLLGYGVNEWAYVLHGLKQGAERGLGLERVPLRLVSVEEQVEETTWRSALRPHGAIVCGRAWTPLAPPMPARILIRLITPLRIRREQDLVEPERLGFDEFVAALLRRLALLTMFHTDCAWRLDHAGLRQIAKEAGILDQRLTWQDWARYSSRQQQKIPMGGVVGSYLLNTNGLEPLWPFLWLGQWTHLGKGAVMGLGRYKIEEAETSRLHKSQPRGEE